VIGRLHLIQRFAPLKNVYIKYWDNVDKIYVLIYNNDENNIYDMRNSMASAINIKLSFKWLKIVLVELNIVARWCKTMVMMIMMIMMKLNHDRKIN
jgi:hypothetical protein